MRISKELNLERKEEAALQDLWVSALCIRIRDMRKRGKKPLRKRNCVKERSWVLPNCRNLGKSINELIPTYTVHFSSLAIN